LSETISQVSDFHIKKRRLENDDWVVIICCIVSLQIVFCWGIDISVSAMLLSPDAVLYNGWMFSSPILKYHVCLYGLVLSCVLQMIIGIHILFIDRSRNMCEKKNEEKKLADVEICRDGGEWVVKIGILTKNKNQEFRHEKLEDITTEMQNYLSDELDDS